MASIGCPRGSCTAAIKRKTHNLRTKQLQRSDCQRIGTFRWNGHCPLFGKFARLYCFRSQSALNSSGCRSTNQRAAAVDSAPSGIAAFTGSHSKYGTGYKSRRDHSNCRPAFLYVSANDSRGDRYCCRADNIIAGRRQLGDRKSAAPCSLVFS